MDHGIFLVQTFRCIIEKNLDENGFINDNEKIQNILKDNIFGIDINDESIDVTIFSLYLTILDYKNPRTLQGFKFPNIKNSNLFIYDFFDNKVTKILEKIQFDVIIGNPPWGSVDGKHLEYCIKNNYPNAQKEISRSFIYRVKEFCSTKTKCCLVLPSKLLYNSQKPAAEFRKVLLENTKIEKIIELSTVRNLLFKNAKAPSIILVFNIDNTDYLENEIEHICFKPNIFFEYFNIIALERNDIKFIPQIFLRDNDWAWKVLLYGTIYDVEIIKRIRKSYKTLQDIINEYKLIAKSGISAGEGKKDSRHFIGKKILDARQDMDSFFINYDNMKKFNKISIYRVATKEQFVPPYCIIKKGLDVNTYRMRAAYSEKEFLYTNGIYAIKGERKDTDILLNITGLINSSLYAYLNFMLGTSAGIEREQGFFKEIKTFPYVYSEEIKKKVKEIQKEKQLKWNFKRASNEKQLIKELDDIILEKFNLEDNNFIDYILNVQIPIIKNKKDIILKEVKINDLKKYSQVFIKYFSQIFNKENKFIKVIIYPKIVNRFSIFELVICDKKPNIDIEIKENVDYNKEIMTKFSIQKYTDMFYQIKDVVNFEENSFYIIKTNEYKNWHPAMANIDLDTIIEELLSENGGDC